MDDDRPVSVFSTSSRSSKCATSFAIYYCNLVFVSKSFIKIVVMLNSLKNVQVDSFPQGICMTFLSPLVLEFTSRFNSSVDHVSKVFTIILICYLSSALLCTLLFKCVNRQKVVIFLISLVATAFFLIPSATNLSEFYVFSSLIGLGCGGYDTVQVAWIIDIWRDESPPWILSQHFAYSLGTLAAPMILTNFLTNSNSTDELGTRANDDLATVTVTDIHIPFYIAGSLAIVSVVINIILLFAYRNRHRIVIPIGSNIQEPTVVEPLWESESIVSRSSSSSNVSVTTALISRNRDSSKRRFYVIGLCCCVIGFYSALELCTQQFLPTYAHFSPMKLSPSEGARILFGLQLGFTVGRLIGIFLVLKVRAHFIFAGNFILLSSANTILFIWGGTSMTLLWIGSIMIGVGMSTVYPSLYAFIEKYLFVTETVSGTITIAGGFVASIYPLIVGHSVETNPEVLMYVNYVSISVCSIAFSLLFSMTYMRSRRGYSRIE